MQTTANTIKSAEVRSRIEPDLKMQSTEVLSGLGLDMSDAIRLFLRQVVATRGLPFEIREPNATTLAAMAEARSMRGKARFNSPEEFFDGIEKQCGKSKKGKAAKKD